MKVVLRYCQGLGENSVEKVEHKAIVPELRAEISSVEEFKAPAFHITLRIAAGDDA
jgi:hypothetical protein